MPRLSGPQVITELRRLLQNQSGRHLYVVLGSYAQLETFEKDDLAQSQMADGCPFPEPVRFNRELLAGIEDATLRSLVRDESRRQISVEDRLNRAFDDFLRGYFEKRRLLILKQCELMFSYNLDLSKLRTNATDKSHLLLLFPGRIVSQQIQLFHEAGPQFQRQFPGQLVTENNLWELNG